MLYNSPKIQAETEADEGTFRRFVDTVLAHKPVALTTENDEETEKILENNEAHLERKINDGVTVKVDIEKVTGRGLSRSITLIEDGKVTKYVLWPIATSENGVNKVGLRSYNSENVDEGIENFVKPEELLDVFMTIATYFLMEER